jgi:hypothetical protein
MSGQVGWLRSAGVAARVAADRGDLWLPGTLGALTYLAWLPLVVTVASIPRASDLAFFGAELFSSELFPLNVLLIAVLGALGILLGCLLAALAEATLLRATGLGTPGRSFTQELEMALSVMLVAVLPAVAAGAALISAVAAVAPAEFGAPDLGVPLVVRIGLRVAPLLAAVVVLAWLGQAFGAVAMRQVIGPGALPLGAGLKTALRDVTHHPLRRLGLALSSFLADLLAVALAIALLRVVWAPIDAELSNGQLVTPVALLLLVGFVAIWLAVILAFGALHVWVSTWWSFEIGTLGEVARPEAQEAIP